MCKLSCILIPIHLLWVGQNKLGRILKMFQIYKYLSLTLLVWCQILKQLCIHPHMKRRAGNWEARIILFNSLSYRNGDASRCWLRLLLLSNFNQPWLPRASTMSKKITYSGAWSTTFTFYHLVTKHWYTTSSMYRLSHLDDGVPMQVWQRWTRADTSR